MLQLEKLTAGQPANLEEIITRLRSARPLAQDLVHPLREPETDPRAYWARQVARQVTDWNAVIDKYLRPVEILMAPPVQLMSLGEAVHEFRREALAATFSLRHLASDGSAGLAALLALHGRREEMEIPEAVREWLDRLVNEVEQARAKAAEELARLDQLLTQSQELEDGMGLRFLYDEERRIFAIGYQVAERRLDNSFYDLLASEARLTSLLAIARGEVPVEHWWALGRPFRLRLRTAAAPFLDRDDVRIPDAAPLHPDARELAPRSRLSRCGALPDRLCREKQGAVGHLGIGLQRARPE